METNCGLVGVESVECAYPTGADELGDACPASAARMASGADLVLEVDPALSGTGEPAADAPAKDAPAAAEDAVPAPPDVASGGAVVVPLAGAGAASTGPAAFLVAIVDGTSAATVGGVSYADWRFWFTTDIAVAVGQGSFTVPVSQAYALSGRGRQGDSWATATFLATQDAVGGFDLGGGTWWLDYTSATELGAVNLHLEGAIVESAP